MMIDRINETVRLTSTDISYGLENIITDDQIVEAALKSNIHEFIQSLPDGYNTILDEKITLNAIQKNRLAIAR